MLLLSPFLCCCMSLRMLAGERKLTDMLIGWRYDRDKSPGQAGPTLTSTLVVEKLCATCAADLILTCFWKSLPFQPFVEMIVPDCTCIFTRGFCNFLSPGMLVAATHHAKGLPDSDKFPAEIPIPHQSAIDIWPAPRDNDNSGCSSSEFALHGSLDHNCSNENSCLMTDWRRAQSSKATAFT